MQVAQGGAQFLHEIEKYWPLGQFDTQIPVASLSVKDVDGVHDVQKNEVPEQVKHGSWHYWHWLNESRKNPDPPAHPVHGGTHRTSHWFPFRLKPC